MILPAHWPAAPSLLAMLAQAVTAVWPPSPARAATTTMFTPVADASIYSGKPGTNFGSATRLVADNSPKTKASCASMSPVWGRRRPAPDCGCG